MKEVVEHMISKKLITPTIPKKRQVAVEEKDRLQDATAVNKPLDAIYMIKHEGRLLRVFTTGNNLYRNLNVSVLPGSDATSSIAASLPGNISCVWCRQPIRGIFIPSIITGVTGMTFEGYDPACSFGCAKSHLEGELRCASSSDRFSLIRAGGYLNRFAYTCGVIKESKSLRGAPDWRLLDANGGSYTPANFYTTNSKTLVRQAGVIVIPVKLSYVENQN